MEPRTFGKEIEDSTNIILLSYNAPERCLIVTFNSGSTYEYTDVPVDVAENFLQAKSVGKFFHQNIRGNYKYQRVETKMATKTVKQAVCDRCGSVISSEDEDAGQLSLDQMTDEWDLSGSSITLADLCGSCVRVLRAWYQAGITDQGRDDG